MLKCSKEIDAGLIRDDTMVPTKSLEKCLSCKLSPHSEDHRRPLFIDRANISQKKKRKNEEEGVEKVITGGEEIRLSA